MRVTFYALSDSTYFPAVVALVNSLRLMGHTEEVVIGDSGLTPAQQEQLAHRCTIFPIPGEVGTVPTFRAGKTTPFCPLPKAKLKPFAYLLRPNGIVAIIDSDMIVTASLQESINLAREGKICGFVDPERDRHFAEWRYLFGLSQPLRQQPYITSSYVVFSTTHWPALLERWWRACEAIPSDRTMWQHAPNSDPIAQGDQDALNAVLMTEIPQGALHFLTDEERPIGKGSRVRVVNSRVLSCTYEGHPVKLLHADGRHKPWIASSFLHVANEPYVRLLRRLLVDPDLPLSVPAEQLPIWLRRGPGAVAALWCLSLFNAATHPITNNERCRRFLKRILKQGA